MDHSFTIASLAPPVSWQSEKTAILIDAAESETTRNAAISDICAAFDPYIRQIAGSWWRRFGYIHGRAGRADLESAGRHGLIVALKRWKPAFRKPLVHLASRWISEMCKTEAARLSQGPCDLPANIRRLCSEHRKLRRTASVADQDALLKGTRQRTKNVVRYFSQGDTNRGLSFDEAPLAGHGPHPLIASLATERAAVPEAAELNETLETVRAVLMERCSPRQRLVFYLQFPNVALSAKDVGAVSTKSGSAVDISNFDFGAKEARCRNIAEVLGLTRERVRQLNLEMLTKLRAGFPVERPSFRSVAQFATVKPAVVKPLASPPPC